jgi:hypothetical protein
LNISPEELEQMTNFSNNEWRILECCPQGLFMCLNKWNTELSVFSKSCTRSVRTDSRDFAVILSIPKRQQ